MQKYWNTVLDERGSPRSGATVAVQQSSVNSTIYADQNGAVPKTNPITTDSRGYFEFYAAAGEYDLVVSGQTFDTYTITDGAVIGLPSADITFTQSGTGASSRTMQAKGREVVSPEDFGCIGDGTTDDRANFQACIDALSTAGGGVIRCSPSKTYLIKEKSGSTKQFGTNNAVSFGLELKNNVVIDGQFCTIKGESGAAYCLISNVTTTGSATNNNSNLGIINAIVDFNSSASGGDSPSASFWGVRKLRLDNVEFKNGYNITLQMENCDEFDIGSLVFRGSVGAAFSAGGDTSHNGGECTKGSMGSLTFYDTDDHPTNPGLPGNPIIFNVSLTEIGEIKAYNSDSGLKLTDGNDIQIGRVLDYDGNSTNCGLKISGGGTSQIVERVSVGEVVCKTQQGSGLFITYSRDVNIGSYLGVDCGQAGSDPDVWIASDRVHVGRITSINAGQGALSTSTTSGAKWTGPFTVSVGDMYVKNCFSVAVSGTATAVGITNGNFECDNLTIIDTNATPKVARYLDTGRTKEQSVHIKKFKGRGPTGNPDFFLTGLLHGWVGNPDIAPLNFGGGALTLSASSVGTGRTATAASAVFSSTAADVGRLIFEANGQGVAEITAFTSTTEVTVAIRVAFSGTSIADDAWYLDRGNGGQGAFAPANAATSTAVTDYGFINTTSRGFPIISVVPTNASARTLGQITGYTFAGTSVTFSHAAAAGTETYQYKILGWTGPQ